MSKLTFWKSLHKLKWGNNSYAGVSGGFGKGPLPSGEYEVRVRHVVVNPPGSGYKDSSTGKSWFIPIKPKFSTTRGGFGIHPDGSPKGTKGCIGLQGNDSQKFWKAWNATAMGERPKELTVKG
jgi:L,D-transpeptidase catalytic domain